MKKHLIIILSVVLTACGSSNFTEEIKEVEELETNLQLLQNTFNQIDTIKVVEAKKAYKQNMVSIKNYFVPDTVNTEFTRMMNDYKNIKVGTRNFASEYKVNKANIALLKTQLAKLKTDLENDAVEADSAASFIDFERINLEKLNESVGTLVYNCETVVNIHDTLTPKIIDLVNNNTP